MRENRTYGSEGGVSRWLIPTPIAIMRVQPVEHKTQKANGRRWKVNGESRTAEGAALFRTLLRF